MKGKNSFETTIIGLSFYIWLIMDQAIWIHPWWCKDDDNSYSRPYFKFLIVYFLDGADLYRVCRSQNPCCFGLPGNCHWGACNIIKSVGDMFVKSSCYVYCLFTNLMECVWFTVTRLCLCCRRIASLLCLLIISQW